jgi:protocatechuate 3,4-dioxygenase, beta subunit
MTPHPFPTSRRAFLGACGAALFTTPGLFAEELTRTPRTGEGPLYPDKLPLDTDNDLLILNDGLTPAVGEVTHLGGRVLGPSGSPLRGVVVEIWQADHQGIYIHTRDDRRAQQDKNFQGFGRFTTGSTGEYYFRTIKPVPYTGRPAGHVHFKLKKGGKVLLTTECYVKGAEGNDRDGVRRSIRDPKARESVTVAFVPVKGSRVGELAAKFDIVLGETPEN